MRAQNKQSGKPNNQTTGWQRPIAKKSWVQYMTGLCKNLITNFLELPIGDIRCNAYGHTDQRLKSFAYLKFRLDKLKVTD